MNTVPEKNQQNGGVTLFDDKTLWIAGISAAVLLIIIKLLFFFPRGVSDTAPFILTDLAKLIERMRDLAGRFYLWTIAYITLLAVFSKYLQNMKLDGARKAIFLIMAITGLSLIPELYGKLSGSYYYHYGDHITLNNVISGIFFIVNIIAQMYIAAALLNYSDHKNVWIKRLAVTMIIIAGIPLIDIVFFLPYLGTSLFNIDLNNWYGIYEFEIIAPVNRVSAIFKSVSMIVLYYIFFRIFIEEKKKIRS